MIKRYTLCLGYDHKIDNWENEQGSWVKWKDAEPIVTELREIKAVCHAYDKVINSLGAADKISFINKVPQQYRDALGKA